MNYYLLSLLILLLGFIFYCHIYVFLKQSNNYEILQVSNPNIDILEKAFLDKLPIVITDVVDQWDAFNEIDFEYLKVQPDLCKDKVAIKLLDKYSKNLLLPFKISHWYSNNINKIVENEFTKLKKVDGHRHLIVQMEGKMRYILFYPNQSKNLHNIKSNNTVDFWNWSNLSQEEKDKFPNFPKASYIELILSKNKILHLPKGWWYASQALEDSIQMTIDSNSIFSFFIK
jgi:hypothetical protein